MDPTIELTPDDDKPVEVTRANRFLLASLVLGLIASVVHVGQLVSGVGLIAALGVAAVFFGVYLWFISKISQGRNWARILFLILVLLGLPFAVPTYMAELRKSLLSGSVSILIALLQLAGTALLFTRNSNRWFRTRKSHED